MKHCPECRAFIEGAGEFCPLCGAELENAPPCDVAAPPNPYPDLSGQSARSGLIVRLLIFVSALGCGVCLLVNLLVDYSFLWSLIVIAAAVYLWLSVPPLLRRGANYTKRIMFQVIFTCLLMVVLDLLIGYDGWSVSYVVPGLLCSGILSIGMMTVFNRTKWAQYVLYQVLMGVFGFVPLLLYLLGFAHSMVMVIVTASLALASLLATMVFGDRTIKTEFKRRFHL